MSITIPAGLPSHLWEKKSAKLVTAIKTLIDALNNQDEPWPHSPGGRPYCKICDALKKVEKAMDDMPSAP